MKTRSYQELYDYVFGNRADVEALLAKRKAELKKSQGRRLTESQSEPDLKLSATTELAHSEDKILQSYQAELESKCQNFFEMIKISSPFRVALRAVNAGNLEKILYKNNTDEIDEKLDPYEFPKEDEIRNYINLKESAYPFFSPEEKEAAVQQFILFFKLAKIVADFIEMNNTPKDAAAYEHAHKMLILFGEKNTAQKQLTDKVESKKTQLKQSPATTMQFKKLFKHLDTFIDVHNLSDVPAPLHDTLVSALPFEDRWGKTLDRCKKPVELEAWRKIIRAKGKRACRIFSNAVEIQESLGGRAPKNFAEAFEQAKKLIYKNAAANPELAELCLYYDVSETNFNRSLEIVKTRKTSDNFPDIAIDGKDVDHAGYHLVKLPIADLHAFVLGQMTDCCQFIGGNGELCTIDGLTRKNNGFYVLLKDKKQSSPKDSKQESKDKTSHPAPLIKSAAGLLEINYKDFEIVGQGYAWKSFRENLTFDSWENLRPDADDPVIVDMLKKFAQEVVEQKDSSVFRVTIGLGGKTPEICKKNFHSGAAELMREGTNYGDAKVQYEIFGNPKRTQLFAELQLMFTKFAEYRYGRSSMRSSDIISEIEIKEIKALCKDTKMLKLLEYRDIKNNLRGFGGDDEKLFFLLKDLALLSKNNLISKANIEFVLTVYFYLGHRFKIFGPILMSLDNNGILNQTNLDLLNNNRENMQTIEAVITALSLEKLSEYITVAVKEPRHAAEVVPGIFVLKNAGLLNSDNLNMILQVPVLATKCAFALKILNEHGAKNDFTPEESVFLSATLNQAAEKGHDSLLSLLVTRVELKREETLFSMIKGGYEKYVKLLVAQKANINWLDPAGDSLLHVACDSMKTTTEAIVTTLLEAKANPNVENHFNRTPLFSACDKQESEKVIAMLLEAKADPNAVDNGNSSPLHVFCQSRNYDRNAGHTLEALIAARANINAQTAYEKTPLDLAIIHQNHRLIAVLLKQKDIEIKKKTEWGSRELYFDDEVEDDPTKFPRALVILSEEKLLIPENAESTSQLIHCGKKFYKTLNTLKDAKLLNQENLSLILNHSLTLTPLLIAIRNQNKPSAAELNDVLYEAVRYDRNLNLINLLLSLKIITADDDVGYYKQPLIASAAYQGSIDIVKTLLDNKASLKSLEEALFITACSHNPRDPDRQKAIINLLLEAKASPNAIDTKDRIGNTLLHSMVQNSVENSEIYQLLFDAHADINAKNKAGKTPLQIAENKIILASLQFNKITPEHITWLTEQIIKLNLQDYNQLKQLTSLLEEKSADKTKVYQAVTKLREILISEQVKPNSSYSKNTLFIKSEKEERSLEEKIYSLLFTIEKSPLCRTSLDLPAKIFPSIVDKLFDELPGSIATEQKAAPIKTKLNKE